MRIAILGPFTGSSLASSFSFPEGTQLPDGYLGAPLMAAYARALVNRGHTVAAITSDKSSFPGAGRAPSFKAFDGQGLRAYFCPERIKGFRPANGHVGKALDLFSFERRGMMAAIADFAPDVVHAHWTYEFAWAALDSGFPTVVTAHDSPWKVLKLMPDLYRALRFGMARRVIPRCRYLTAVSADLAADVQKFTRTPVAVVANPIADDVMNSRGCTAASFQSQTLVMVLNGWDAWKNGAAALRAFAIARQTHPNLRMVCFGWHWEPEGVAQRWARSQGIDAGIDFRGPVPHAAILSQMQDSAMLLHPSRLEACSMTIAEALSVGLPVIAGRSTAGVPWQLDGGQAGLLVDVNDPASMARAVLDLTTDPARWTHFSVAGRARARSIFAADRVVDQYMVQYEAACAASASSAPLGARARQMAG
ncbi:glycosyltransferase family 4 protein [Methylibium petroleiphilum]|uniref:glycosyltransferase family 4 protein n=1 Tax=Methylibium petroleiphilum TaxID=105560 RepID=UPI001ACEBDBA|nr:glycosyltransferase family 4 protein [Methylibium petroleiphilum]MBN9205440.1 glycosyltransferase family 4 protein [Methylibium petroleiphilum]